MVNELQDLMLRPISLADVREIAAKYGAELTPGRERTIMIGLRAGILASMLTYIKQEPELPFPPVKQFQKLNPTLRELFGSLCTTRSKPLCKIQENATLQLSAKDRSLEWFRTSYKSLLTSIPGTGFKVARQTRPKETYSVLAFVSDELADFAAPENGDPLLAGIFDEGGAVKGVVKLARNSLKRERPYKRDARLAHRVGFDAATGKLVGVSDYLDPEVARRVRPTEFCGDEITYMMAVFGEADCNVALRQAADGSRRLHFWTPHAGVVFYWGPALGIALKDRK